MRYIFINFLTSPGETIEVYLFIYKFKIILIKMINSKTLCLFIMGFLCGLVSISLLTAMGLSSYGLYKSQTMPRTIKQHCSGFYCNVTVIGRACYARFVDLPNASSYNVICDKPRSGFYKIVLPCDSDLNGRPILNCDYFNEDRDHLYEMSGVGLCISILAFVVMLFAICLIHVHFSERVIENNNIELSTNVKHQEPASNIQIDIEPCSPYNEPPPDYTTSTNDNVNLIDQTNQ